MAGDFILERRKEKTCYILRGIYETKYSGRIWRPFLHCVRAPCLSYGLIVSDFIKRRFEYLSAGNFRDNK